jgi:hypothetical protein
VLHYICVKSSKSGLKIISSISYGIHTRARSVCINIPSPSFGIQQCLGWGFTVPPTPAHVQVNLHENIYARIRRSWISFFQWSLVQTRLNFVFLCPKEYVNREILSLRTFSFAIFLSSNKNLKRELSGSKCPHEVTSAMSMLVTVFLGVNEDSLIVHVSDKTTSTFRVACFVGEV